MADPKGPSWSFGGAGSNTSSGTNLFGQPAPNTSKPGNALFGSSANPPTSSSTSPFGSTTSAGGNSLFGAVPGSGQTNAFGAGTSNSIFGAGNTQSGGAFGQAGSQSNQSTSMAAPSSGFFSTPNKPAESTNATQNQTPNPFGGGNGSGGTGGLFGNLSSKTSSSDQANTTTPTSKPTTSLFGNSTTPAGLPPNTSTGNTGSSLFGKPATDTENLFAPKTDFSTKGANTMAPPPSGNGFSSFNFQQSKPQESVPVTSKTQPAGVLGSTSATGGSDLFGKRAAPSEGGLFQNLNKAQDTGASKTSFLQQPQNEATKAQNPFNLGNQTSTSNSTLAPQPASTPSSLFPKISETQNPATTPAAAPSTTQSSFNLFTKPTSSAAATPSTSAPSMFSNLGKPQEKPASSVTEAAGTTAPSTSAPASAPSLFGSITKPTNTSAAPQAPGPAATSGTAPGAGAANATLGTSTAGPLPPAQSRLKNKSMDDIITRWASDLSKYQKEFREQAEKVAAWDRMLVENSEKIQKLYGSTLEAERATAEVERQLTAVESDQAELAHWLDYYEKEVDSMITSTIGQDGTLSGPDQERERTYQLASKLSERLDEMGKDLTGMIEEINDASSTLTKNNQADDPLSQVVRVLNGHLTQLQQIDQGAAALQLKVQQAQRTAHTLGPSSGLSGPSSDAADGFYRSYMGRR